VPFCRLSAWSWGEDGAERARPRAAVAGGNYLGASRRVRALLAQHSRLGRQRAQSRPLRCRRCDAATTPAGEIHASRWSRAARRAARCARARALARRLAAPTSRSPTASPGAPRAALDNCLLYEEIQSADRRKNEFLATLSHELRNPLAPMRAALHMLRAETSTPARRPLLETMDRQVAQMTRLVEDLLDISRITRGVDRAAPRDARRRARDPQRHRVVPGPLESAATSSCEPAAGAAAVVADRVRLQQILENLILNAVKYTEPGGRIEVSAEPSSRTS
jgi:signal transduction histidine kinase